MNFEPPLWPELPPADEFGPIGPVERNITIGIVWVGVVILACLALAIGHAAYSMGML